MKLDIRKKRLLKLKRCMTIWISIQCCQLTLNISFRLWVQIHVFPWKQSDSSIVGFSNKQVHYEKRKRWYRYNFRQLPRFLGPKKPSISICNFAIFEKILNSDKTAHYFLSWLIFRVWSVYFRKLRNSFLKSYNLEHHDPGLGQQSRGNK